MGDEQNNPDRPKQSIRTDVPGDLLRIMGEFFTQKTRESTHSVYANALNLAVNDLDFKIIFGEGQPQDWHTAVTMSWGLVKLLTFYLQSNLAVHEIAYGPVKLPTALFPEPIIVPPDAETNPISKRVFETLQSIRQTLMDEQMQLWRSEKPLG
jgi:hypothetical protein